MSALVCLGLGYSARAVARDLCLAGWSITGTGRGEATLAAGRSQGYAMVGFDGTSTPTSLLTALADATHVLVSIAPDADGDPVLRQLAGALAAARRLAWIGYLSTVGVYGDHGGAWVDETTPPVPTSQRSRWRVAAEADWLALGQASGKRVEVFRLAGIYGPGRSAVENLRAGTARRIVKPGQVFNRIHVADIVGTVRAAIARPTPFNIFNVTDDEPAPPQDVVAFAARAIGMPVPPEIPFDAAPLSAMGRSFYSECKRVSNQRIKSALGVRLLCPTYREGIAQILAVGD